MIQLTTHSDYSHTGMLVVRNKKSYIFKAIGPVKYTPLKQWIAHGEKSECVVHRVEGELSVEQQQKLAQTAKRYLGKPYDFNFSWSDDRQYCSEVGGRFTRTRWGCAWVNNRSWKSLIPATR